MRGTKTAEVTDRMIAALDKINVAVVVNRVRTEELVRSDTNGGTPEAHVARVEAAVAKLEQAAALLKF